MTAGRAERAVLQELLADPEASFALGGPGASAEFLRGAEEPADVSADGLALATPRGAIRLAWPAGARLIAYEAVSRHAGRWQQGLIACLPEAAAAMGGRAGLTELGPDREALRPADREARLFDLGLGRRDDDFCVRTADQALIDLLRGLAGQALTAWPHAALAALVAAGPERVVASRFGRIEVRGPIPHETTPLGPHSHLFPERLAAAAPHDPDLPVPPGWRLGLQLFPAHPQIDLAGRPRRVPARHAAFQALLAAWGDPAYLVAKAAGAEGGPGEIARRQAAWLAGRAAPGGTARES